MNNKPRRNSFASTPESPFKPRGEQTKFSGPDVKGPSVCAVYSPGDISPASSGGASQSPLKATSRSQPRYHLYCGGTELSYLYPKNKVKRGDGPLPAELPPRLGFSSHAGDARERLASQIFSLSRKIRCVVRGRIAPVLPREVMARKNLLRFEFTVLGPGIDTAVLSAVYFCS